MNMLTEPLLGIQEIRLRRDLHYGEHDPLLMPQLYNSSIPHLSCIPLASAADNTIMWRLPSEDDFEPIDGHKLSAIPLGLFTKTLVGHLSHEYHNVLSGIDSQPNTNNIACPSLSADSKIKDYRSRARYLLNQLACPATFKRARMTWRIAQRVCLELAGRIIWLRDINQNFSTSHAWLVPETRQVIGCLTEDPYVVENCYRVSTAAFFSFDSTVLTLHLTVWNTCMVLPGARFRRHNSRDSLVGRYHSNSYAQTGAIHLV